MAIFCNLHRRIVFFFTILLMFVQLVAFYLINATSLEIAQNQNIVELNTGKRIFQQFLTQNRQRLVDTATLLSADFGFRKAIATNDTGTIMSVLNNHGSRIKADAMMLASTENILLADTLNPNAVAGISPLTTLIAEAEQKGEASGVLMLAGRAYQVVLVPVLAPDPIAWVAMGFLVDNHLAQQLRDVTNLHVSFLSKSAENQWTLLASTQPNTLSQAILQTPTQAATSNPSFAEPVVLGEYATLVSVLQQQADFTFFTVLQRSVQDAVKPLHHLRTTLFELAIVSLWLSLLVGSFLAKKITNPIRVLADLVDNIRRGDFSQATQLQATESASAEASGKSLQEVDILRTAYREILRLAHEDVLTGLPNRALFNDRLKQMVKLGKRTNAPFTVLMIDLNRFKFINDTLGHHAGDEVIRIVGQRLRGVLRESDTVARLGGDEFAFLLPTGDQKQVLTVTQKIQQQIEIPMTLDEQQVDISCSIGVTFYPQHGQEAETLLRHADVAMYLSKRNKNGAEIYDPDLDSHQDNQANFLTELRLAVEEDQFSLCYLPQIDFKTGRVLGVEALIFWNHPTRGMLYPKEFIAFAEGSGLIRLITQWVIGAVVQQAASWMAQGLTLNVSMNISAQDLVDPKFPDLVKQVLQANHVPPSRICLEITEAALTKDPKGALAAMERLQQIGISISLDDYGTGNSSLAWIKKLPVHSLKIDSAFIAGLIENPKDKAVVVGAIALAHGLGFKVVAEGVENTNTFSMLQRLGCDQLQGFLVSQPIAADQIAAWINAANWEFSGTSDPSVKILESSNLALT